MPKCDKDLKILFITRKFPPAVGGMERHAQKLFLSLSKFTRVELVKWSGSNRLLPFVLTYLLIKSVWVLASKRVNLIHLQDGLIAPIGFFLKLIFRKPVILTVHGLDVTYESRFYQLTVLPFIKRMDKIVAVSKATAEVCMRKGISHEKICVVSNGVSDEFYVDRSRDEIREKLESKLHLPLKNKKIILSVGRLVKRKGFHWFVENVLPKLVESDENIIYLIAGDGPMKKKIEISIKKANMEKHAVLLGEVDDETLKLLYNSADVFVMPNIPVEGDIEGFGLVALESASCGTPVVASNIEGIKDAVIQSETGFLVEPCNAEAFVNTIINVLRDQNINGSKIRESTLRNFSWDRIAMKYCELYKSTIRL